MTSGNVCRILAFVVLTTSLSAQVRPQRPKILGIAHVAIDERNPEEARAFYQDLLGFAIPFSLKHPDGSSWISYVKINDEQYLELFTGNLDNRGEFNHFALYTDDLADMQQYLSAHRVKIVEPMHVGHTRNSFLAIQDPEGHLIEIVQYQPGSWTDAAKGKFLLSPRVASRISSLGLLVYGVPPVVSFYENTLGFREVRLANHAGAQGRILRVPDGADYIEFLHRPGRLSPNQVRTKEYIGLTSPNAQKSLSDLLARPRRPAYKPVTSANGARGFEVFDPVGTQIEILQQ
jgi:catechol 2,3-dioxygenase-like lactoylglutathione lyase family enzyme